MGRPKYPNYDIFFSLKNITVKIQMKCCFPGLHCLPKYLFDPLYTIDKQNALRND